jgi:phage terminase small subunit
MDAEKTDQQLPSPPDRLNEIGRDHWKRLGLILVRKDVLNDSVIEKLSDLCFWKQQKADVLKSLNDAETNPLQDKTSRSFKSLSSIHLSSVKAIQKEIDQLNEELGIDQHSDDDLSDTPVVPDDVYQSLPELLAGCCDLFDNRRQRDLFLTGSLSLTGAVLQNVVAEHAEGLFSTNLNVMMVCSGNGSESVLQNVQDLARPLRLSNVEQGELEPGYPFADPGQHLVSFLKACNGYGLMCRSLDEKSVADQERDEWTTLLKKSFYHREVIESRNGNSLFVDRPALSACFTANPDRFSLLYEPEQNHYYSLYALYGFEEQEEGWSSQRPARHRRLLDRQISTAGEQLALLNRLLINRREPIYIELTDDQWQMIDETFAEKLEIIRELNLSDALQLANQRAAIQTLKMCAICTVLRTFEAEPSLIERAEAITPSEADMIASLWLADTYLKHAIRLYQRVPEHRSPTLTTDDAKGERYRRFLEILPAKFETASAIEIGQTLDVPVRTAKRYLKTLLKESRIKRVRRGEYEKIAVD